MNQPEAIVDPTHPKKSRSRTSHSEELILGDKNSPFRTRSSFKPSEETLIGLIYVIELIYIVGSKYWQQFW